jgi:dihydroxyacetone kinase-like predicted kinase
MLGEKLDVNQVRKDISAMGWSPLIDGDDRLIKVHIHVYDPGEPISYAIKLGVELDDIVVENMQAQYLQYVQARQQREEQPETPHRVAVVTVARGDGLEELLREYGAARVIIGGQTMNPSTEDFLGAIDSLDTDEVILLPNNGNVLMAAQQAATLAMGKSVQVVPSKTIQQGISALLAYMDLRDDNSLQDIAEGMDEARGFTRSAEVTIATRNAVINDVSVQEGQYIGLLDGKLVHAGGTDIEIVEHLLQVADADQHELATFYYGEGRTEADAEALVQQLAETYPELEFEVVYGGQPLYPYLISIE